jgi:hypothetical protein
MIGHERMRQVPPRGRRGRRDDVDPDRCGSRELRTRTVTGLWSGLTGVSPRDAPFRGRGRLLAVSVLAWTVLPAAATAVWLRRTDIQ